MQIDILSPCRALLISIEQIPDPVFAQKMVGDGCGLDPLEPRLLAPISGVISQLHRNKHAVAIRHASGLELLLHLGLETVSLEGKGIWPKVVIGQEVEAGQTLLEFDVDLLASQARSLISALVITNSEQVIHWRHAQPGLVDQGQVLFSCQVAQSSEPSNAAQGTLYRAEVRLPNPQGIHARPAAVLSQAIKELGVEAWLIKDQQRAKANSLVALMGLGTRRGDLLTLEVQGPNAEQALSALQALISSGLGEDCPELIEGPEPDEHQAQAEAVNQQPEPSLLQLGQQQANQLLGVAASPGLAFAPLYVLPEQLPSYAERAGDAKQEQQRLSEALAQLKAQLDQRQQQASNNEQREITKAHLLMLDDAELALMWQQSMEQGLSAEAAVAHGFSQQMQQLKASGQALLISRCSDLADLQQQLLAILLGVDLQLPQQQVILACHELTPSIASKLSQNPQIQAVISQQGGATSHGAILARSAGVPAVCGLGQAMSQLHAGQPLLVNGDQGWVQWQVSDQDYHGWMQIKQHQAEQKALAWQERQEPCLTQDGQQIQVAANLAQVSDAAKAYLAGAEGSGLVRTEILFEERTQAPDEEQQLSHYLQMLNDMPAQQIVFRTLDVGGDKPLSYLPMPKEDNPFLGERGIRIGINKPSLLRTQLRALLRAHQQTGRVLIMLPMIAQYQELEAVKQLYLQLADELGVQPAPLGIMLEVPSAALMSEQLAELAEFFSIGSNDLTQYVLAMDRGHPQLAAQADGLDPSVLRCMALGVEGANKHQRWVGVCGGLASEPLAVPILLGLGITELSASIASVPMVRRLVRQLNLSECRELALACLAAKSAQQVRQLAQQFLSQRGL